MAIEQICKNCERFGERQGFQSVASRVVGIMIPGKVCRLILGPDDHTPESPCDVPDYTDPHRMAFRPTPQVRIIDFVSRYFPPLKAIR